MKDLAVIAERGWYGTLMLRRNPSALRCAVCRCILSPWSQWTHLLAVGYAQTCGSAYCRWRIGCYQRSPEMLGSAEGSMDAVLDRGRNPQPDIWPEVVELGDAGRRRYLDAYEGAFARERR